MIFVCLAILYCLFKHAAFCHCRPHEQGIGDTYRVLTKHIDEELKTERAVSNAASSQPGRNSRAAVQQSSKATEQQGSRAE